MHTVAVAHGSAVLTWLCFVFVIAFSDAQAEILSLDLVPRHIACLLAKTNFDEQRMNHPCADMRDTKHFELPPQYEMEALYLSSLEHLTLPHLMPNNHTTMLCHLGTNKWQIAECGERIDNTRRQPF